MKVTKTIRANQQGAKRFKRQWGDKLIAVRYRLDENASEFITTIEIEVDRRPKPEPGHSQKALLAAQRMEVVAIHVDYKEFELRSEIKSAGARWSQQLRLWLLRRTDVVSLGLKDRIVSGAAEKCLDVDTSLFFNGAQY